MRGHRTPSENLSTKLGKGGRSHKELPMGLKHILYQYLVLNPRYLLVLRMMVQVETSMRGPRLPQVAMGPRSPDLVLLYPGFQVAMRDPRSPDLVLLYPGFQVEFALNGGVSFFFPSFSFMQREHLC